MANRRIKKKHKKHTREEFIKNNIIKTIPLSARAELKIITPDYAKMRELEEKHES